MKALLIISVIIIGNSYRAMAQRATVAGPHLLVYKTTKDYQDRVPVTLSSDRSKIISYPDPHDIAVAGAAMQPAKLHKGYLLANTGVGINTAFLKLTYTAYAGLKKTPTTQELYKMIIDKNPLTALYDCGLKASYKDPAAQVNELIDKKKLQAKCKRLYPDPSQH